MIRNEGFRIEHHTRLCNEKFVELLEYMYNWPLVCRQCYGSGLFHYTGQLEIKNPVIRADCDACYSRGICPRCAAPRLKVSYGQEVIARDCPFCFWAKTDMALSMKAAPVYECNCITVLGMPPDLLKCIDAEPGEIEMKTLELENMIDSWRIEHGTFISNWHRFEPIFKIRATEAPDKPVTKKKKEKPVTIQYTLDF